MSDLPDPPLPMAPSIDIGSARLAEALATVDVPAVGRALRQDYVVVPLARAEDGQIQTRVFEAGDADDERRWTLCLFTSTQSFADFIQDSPEREFSIRRGNSLAPFLTQHRATLRRVEFDPAGPHPVQASVDDVLAALQEDETDDQLAWITEEGSAPGPDEHVAGLDLHLPEDWARIDLADPHRVREDIDDLVTRQLIGVPQANVLRGQLAQWLTSTARTAASAGGTTMAFLTRRTQTAAAAVSVVQYWHDRHVPGRYLDEAVAQLQQHMSDQEELLRGDTASTAFVRHTHRHLGPDALGAQPVVVIDYWLEFPDRRGLCLVSFSTPHLDEREPITMLTDGIVLASSWRLAPPPAAEDQPGADDR